MIINYSDCQVYCQVQTGIQTVTNVLQTFRYTHVKTIQCLIQRCPHHLLNVNVCISEDLKVYVETCDYGKQCFSSEAQRNQLACLTRGMICPDQTTGRSSLISNMEKEDQTFYILRLSLEIFKNMVQPVLLTLFYIYLAL